MSRGARLALLIVALSTMAAGAGYYFGTPRQAAPPPRESPPTADSSARLLALTLPDLDGKPQALSQWKGKVLVVNFWATWCPPCKEEMPEFSRLHKELSSIGVQFVGISIDTANKVTAFSKETPVSYPLLISGLENLDLASDLGNRAKGLPFTVILRPDGSPQQVKLGKFATTELETAIRLASRQH